MHPHHPNQTSNVNQQMEKLTLKRRLEGPEDQPPKKVASSSRSLDIQNPLLFHALDHESHQQLDQINDSFCTLNRQIQESNQPLSQEWQALAIDTNKMIRGLIQKNSFMPPFPLFSITWNQQQADYYKSQINCLTTVLQKTDQLRRMPTDCNLKELYECYAEMLGAFNQYLYQCGIHITPDVLAQLSDQANLSRDTIQKIDSLIAQFNNTWSRIALRKGTHAFWTHDLSCLPALSTLMNTSSHEAFLQTIEKERSQLFKTVAFTQLYVLVQTFKQDRKVTTLMSK